MMLRGTVAALLIGLLAPAAAADEPVSPLADRLLWCGSAFYWLAADAYDSGEDGEGDQYEAWSNGLMERAALVLASEGRDDTAIEALRDDYDARVVDELGTPDARYDVTACPDLVPAPPQ